MKASIQLIKTAYLPNQLLALQGPVVLLLGRSNSGKSTLLNALFKKTIAKVSKAPGKTRSVNYYQTANRLTIVDLPGYGYAKRSQEEKRGWQTLMKAFFDQLPLKVLALLLMDAKRDLEEDEFLLIDSLWKRSACLQLILTKSDRLNQSEHRSRVRYLGNLARERTFENSLPYAFISAKTGEGVEDLRRELFRYSKDFDS